MRVARAVVVPLLMLCSCASNPPPAPPAPAATQPAPLPTALASADPIPTPNIPPPTPQEHKAAVLPTHCAENKNPKLCVPDAAFVERLCAGAWPDIALVFFRKESPWTRGYVVRAVQAWNATGGAMSTSAKMVVDEELILLRQRGSSGGIVVGGGAGYDVLRWDGTCVSLSGDEVTLRRPGTPKHSPIPWRKLAERTQTALLSDPKIKQSFDRRRKDCQGGATTAGFNPCEWAETSLSSGIVAFVRSGGAVPDPEDLP